MKVIILSILSLMLYGCSTSTSDVHQLISDVDSGSIKNLKLLVISEQVQLSSQASSRIYTLHQNAEEVNLIASLVASRYGFNVLAGAREGETDFYVQIIKAMPDGGECAEGFSFVTQNLSYASSVLTLGVMPASVEHCLVVAVELYRNRFGERELVGEFSSNLGRVSVYAGANEIDNYQLTVDKVDEIRSLELSMGDLFKLMILEGAFEPVALF